MSIALSLIPLVLAFLAYALFVKVAARVVRRASLSWRHALLFSVLALAAGVLGALLLSIAGASGAPALGLIGGLVVNLVLGGWYLGKRATKPDGRPVDVTGGVVIAGSAWIVAILFFGAMVLLPQLLLRSGQA